MKQHTCNDWLWPRPCAVRVSRPWQPLWFQVQRDHPARLAVPLSDLAGPWGIRNPPPTSSSQLLETPWVYAPQAVGASCASTLRAKCQAWHWEARLRTEGMPWLSSWWFSYLTACYMGHGGFVKSHTGKPWGVENLEISPIYLRINPWLYRFFFKSTQWLRDLRGLEDCPAGAFLTILVTIDAQSMLKNHEEQSFKDHWDKHVWVFLKSEAN
jgi:hypothetical protein